MLRFLVILWCLVVSGEIFADSIYSVYQTYQDQLLENRKTFIELSRQRDAKQFSFFSENTLQRKIDQLLDEMYELHEEMNKMERYIDVFIYTPGRTKQSVSLRYAKKQGWPVIENQGILMGFFSPLDFDFWSENIGDKDYRSAHRSFAAQYFPSLKNCLSSNRVAQGDSIKVDRWERSACDKEKRIRHESRVFYTLKRLKKSLRISTNIYFNYKGRPENKLKIWNRLTAAFETCVKDFLSYSGFDLEIGYALLEKGESPGDGVVISLWDDDVRSSSSKWHLWHPRARTCGVVIHELLHLFGLRDEYSEGTCPDRQINFSGMKTIMGGSKNWDGSISRLKNYQVHKILAPLCQ